MFPLWSFGFWQSRERYKSQDELLEVVARHRKLGVPIDGIIQDWQYWGNNYQWNAMEFLNPGFHNPQLMMDSVHSMNAHAIISIWSSFGPQTKQYRELDSKRAPVQHRHMAGIGHRQRVAAAHGLPFGCTCLQSIQRRGTRHILEAPHPPARLRHGRMVDGLDRT